MKKFLENIKKHFTQKKIIVVRNKDQLLSLIDENIVKYGNNCDLNHIDVSNIKDMGSLFFKSNFNGDISRWDVSNVEYMRTMFLDFAFNNDISNWNVSNVTDMGYMFCKAKFNQDITSWNVEKVKEMTSTFEDSDFNQDLTIWKPLRLNNKDKIYKFCNAPIPYWAEADNTPASVKSYLLNKKLETSLLSKETKSKKIKI